MTGSEFIGNAQFGISNLTPATIVQATGNWWGSASGPNDPIANPIGTGDKVSQGVDYGQYSAVQPLIDCSITPVNGSYIANVETLALALTCRNATEVRLSEDNSFANANFVSLQSPANFVLSAGIGNKQIYAEYRGAQGQTIVVQLLQPIIFNPTLPQLSFAAPAAGAVLATDTLVSINASHASGIQKVEFFANGTLLTTVTGSPYQTQWALAAFNNGAYTLRARVTATNGAIAEVTCAVTVAKPNTDFTVPVISDTRFAGASIMSGGTITSPGALTFTLTDNVALARFTIKLDGAELQHRPVSGPSYNVSQFLTFENMANGAHSFEISILDASDNTTTSTIGFTLNLPAPTTVPTITAPSNGATLNASTVFVIGTAPLGTQVRLYLNDVVVEGLINVNTVGGFSTSINLTTEGSYRISADARNIRGTTPRSTDLTVNYVKPAPVVRLLSPAAGTTLSDPIIVEASVSSSVSAIGSVVFKLDGSVISTLNVAPYRFAFDVNEYSNEAHVLSVEVTDAEGRAASDSRSFTIAKRLPPVVTSYTGEVLSVSPQHSYGQTPIKISGRAVSRSTGELIGNATLKLVLTTSTKFQRRITLVTGSDGLFNFNYEPAINDAGSYTLSVIHPNETETSDQGSFSIARIAITPEWVTLNAAIGFPQTYRVNLSAKAGIAVSGVQIIAPAAAQPSGSLPAGVSISTSGAVNIPANTTVPVDITLNSTQATPINGTIILQALATDSGNAVRAETRLNYRLSNPLPAIVPTPTYIETGVAQGYSVTETITFENKGLTPATNVNVVLLNQDGSAAPNWAFLSSVSQLGVIGVGEKQTIQMTFTPAANLVADGIYSFKLRVTLTEGNGGEIPVAVSVTQAGQGKAEFKVVDLYANTLDETNQLIEGVANATIRLQNETIPSITATVRTDNKGNVVTGDLVPGRYTWRANGPNHKDVSGRLVIRPGVVTPQRIFLNYALVSVQFSVTETTIPDKYDVTLTATFVTQVPAPVVLLEPMQINIPVMQVGEEITGELTLTNYGLVRADNLKTTLPESNAYFRIDIDGSIPTNLEAKQRIVLPYKITQLQRFPQGPSGIAAESILLKRSTAINQRMDSRKSLQTFADTRKAGTCYSTGTAFDVSYEYECAAGDKSGGGTATSFNYVYGTSCGGSSGSSAINNLCSSPHAWWCGGGNGGGSGSGSGNGTPIGDKCTPDCPSGTCCNGGGAAAGGGGGAQ